MIIKPIVFLSCRRSRRSCLSSLIGTLRNYDGDGKENVKKAIGLMSKTTTLRVHYAFLYISLLSLHNYKASGYDGLSVRVLKKIAPVFMQIT